MYMHVHMHAFDIDYIITLPVHVAGPWIRKLIAIVNSINIRISDVYIHVIYIYIDRRDHDSAIYS
jgi:hypothetical protein